MGSTHPFCIYNKLLAMKLFSPSSCPNKDVKALFICKRRHIYSTTTKTPISSGLLNSAKFVVDMLNDNGIRSKLVDVIDSNSIDREVTWYKPTHVIIEAIWVTPEKFKVLQKLHPKVKWIIRLHSEIPFLAGEGVAIEWIYEYLKYKNVSIASNSKKSTEELSKLLNFPIAYLPNYYPVTNVSTPNNTKRSVINIGCFGAIRPLKNQLIQAVAAIEFGNSVGKPIHFHINGNRIEGKGDPILKNIESLFDYNPPHKLIKHEWMSHNEFIRVVRKMNMGMQVSYSETFNIVAADFVNNNVPIVVSPEIFWVSDFFKADPNSVDSIVSKLKFTYKTKGLGLYKLNKLKLKSYDADSRDTWIEYFK